jgi:agmatinase
VTDLFTSPFTFARRETKLEEAKYAFLGVPYDGSESYRVGSRFAPRAIREASREIEDYDMQTGVNLLDIKIADLGDIDVVHGNFMETHRRTASVVTDVLEKGVIPLCIGGEHTISYSPLSAYEETPLIIIYDAHLDFRDDYMGEKFSHACVTRRIGELCGYENIWVVGVRSAARGELEDAEKLGLRYLSFHRYHDGLDEIARASKGRNIYLSIDMDVLDPKEASGVGNPEPPGFSYTELVESMGFLCDANLVGFDLTEVAPPYDSYTPILAANIIFKVLVKAKKSLVH